MSKTVQLKILSEVQTNGETDTIEFYSEGQFYEKNNKTYLSYDETELTGMKGSKVVLMIDDHHIEMHRFGTTKAKMIFELNKKTKTNYKTPYGLFKMAIKTHLLTVDLETGIIKINYDLNIKGLSNGHNKLVITIK